MRTSEGGAELSRFVIDVRYTILKVRCFSGTLRDLDTTNTVTPFVIATRVSTPRISMRWITSQRGWRPFFGYRSTRSRPRLFMRNNQRTVFVGCAAPRNFSIDTLTTILIPPAVFGGLLVTLWTYKCLMMIIFQNKIIYMPSIPPFSRSEKVSDYEVQCRPVVWKEHEIQTADRVAIKILEGRSSKSIPHEGRKSVVVLYFQG